MPALATFGFSSSSIPRNPSPIADPGPDYGCVLADAAREHQRVQPTQSRSECADPFLDLVAKERNRLSSPAGPAFHARVDRPCRNRSLTRRADPTWKLTISINCVALTFSERANTKTNPDRDRPSGVLIGTPAVGVKTHACVHGFCP